jgi:hypothetical protein
MNTKAAQPEKLEPHEELDHLKTIHGENNADKLYALMSDSLHILHVRAGMLLSLITITLTITGFSGPQIATSSLVARASIVVGLALVLLSALILMSGPLQLDWYSRFRSNSVDQSIIKLIEVRNFRTRRYHIASAVLLVGLTAYVTSLISFLVTG